jgi:hypothetical protein
VTSGVRVVRHLRVSAPDEAAVRALLPRLEDALRCASLPDGGARVLLVRRLALGRVAAGISAGALAQRVEQQLVESDVTWIDGGTASAERAEHVCFASALDARLQLAARLLRGQPCEAWYWRLAVPEWRRGEPLALQLRAITLTVAGWPEAMVALPAWVAGVVGVTSADGALWLTQAFDESQGAALLRHVGITMRPATPAAPIATRRPAWLQTLLGAVGPPEHAARSDAASRRAGLHGTPESHESHQTCGEPVMREIPALGDHADSASPDTVRLDVDAHRPTPATHAGIDGSQGSGAKTGAASRPVTAPGRSASASVPEPHPSDDTATPDARPSTHLIRDLASVRPLAQTEGAGPASTENPPQTPAYTAPVMPDGRLMHSRCAGLLFLLPVLARLGIVGWCAEAGLDCASFTREVLRGALQRLRVPPDEPAWALVLDVRSGATAAQLAAPPVGPQAASWLRAVRRWLRRHGRIGLARLVLRPGHIGLTATHVDIHFRLVDADLQVRRLGLDIDPGWLPWFGRVVGFHYRQDRG